MGLSTLRELAQSFSIQLSYKDAAGHEQQAGREALTAILKSRVPEGVSFDDALAHRQRQWWARGIEPVIVVWGRRRPVVDLRLPQMDADTTLHWSITFDDGGERSGSIELRDVEVTKTGEHSFVGKTFPIDQLVPYGYHTLRIEVGEQRFESLIIAAPQRAHELKKKSWGIFAPLYGAHTRRSWGAGDLGDLLAYIDWMHDLQGNVVATLPMLAAFDDEPSPYSPVSRLFWNEMYLDVTRLPEFRAGDEDPGALAHLQQARQVPYDEVRRTKRRLIEQQLLGRFIPDDEYARFEAHAREYAEFRARIEKQDSAAYHLYVQYRMAQQMREVAGALRKVGGGLYLDFPLGVNAGGYDVWKYGDVFARGMSVGSPPDPFFTKGQDWGFPPLDPDALRDSRYEYFRACIRHHVSHAGMLRIDHVMALHRLFWIPEGAEAKQGVYVSYPEEELYAIVVLESFLHRCAIVGEDLGTVPEEVPKRMEEHGLRRMFVVQYEINPDHDPPFGTPPAESVASVNTHDMPPWAAFWNDHDIDDRVAQGLLDERGAKKERETREQVRRALTRRFAGPYDAHKMLDAILGFLASSDAELVLVNLEDLWGETAPQNVPGVPEKSWRQKLRLSLDQMRGESAIEHVLRRVGARRLLPEDAKHS